MGSVLEPFLLSLVAGMATGIGGIIALVVGRISDRIAAFSMGFASGVMLLVSFVDLFLQGSPLLAPSMLIISFSLGAIMMIILDLAIPHIELTTKMRNGKNARMRRAGVLIAVGITLHNFPEGFVVSAGYSYVPTLGVVIAIAIMLHNIPEGIATAIPLSQGTMKKPKIAALTFLSGLAEPLGALVGAIALSFVGTGIAVGFSLIFAAGVMTYITADELIPVSHEYGYKHTVSVSLLLGIIFALMISIILK
jgi:ZIP family zinc transporter